MSPSSSSSLLCIPNLPRTSISKAAPKLPEFTASGAGYTERHFKQYIVIKDSICKEYAPIIKLYELND
jgi:hypothetical protein